ncbi:GYF_domain [Hexamita inflata]|uniref:GYF domain n=1 Tax=Hexamita inflata TaxID=28002 RepID=A0AA86Q4Q7_9EUKA|nr:GYF domain [Hexamita inflata]
MSDSESSSTSSYSEPEDTAQSSYMSKQTQNQAPKQAQNVQQESSTSDDAEFQKQMKQSITVFNEVKRCGFSNAVVQTGKGYCVQNGIVFTRPYTVPTEDKQTQKNENDEIEEEQNKINENQIQSQKETKTNQKETEVEEFNTKEKDDFALKESESVKEEQEEESESIQISDDKSNQEDEKKKLEAEKRKQQEQVEQYQSPKSKINHTGQTQMNEQLIKKQPAQTEPNQSQKSDWFYIDNKNIRRGPFTSAQMNTWNMKQKLPLGLKIQQGNGEFFTLKQEHLKMSSFFKDLDEIILVETQTQTDVFQYTQSELIKLEISTVNEVKNVIVQRDLTKEQKSVNAIINEIDKIAVPPGVEKGINTYLSLRRQGKDYLYIDNQDYIENKFTDYRDLQAIGVGVQSVTRIPIIKKEQKDRKESIFAPGAGDSKHNQNPDFNPEAGKNETEKPKTNKAYYFEFDQNQTCYDLFDVDDFFRRSPDEYQRPIEDSQINNQPENYTHTNFNENNVQKSQQQVNTQEKQQYYELNNESINYYPFDESTNEQAMPEQEQSKLELTKLEKPEQITNPPTESKSWSESQWDAFRTVVFQAIKNYFNTEFETLEEALVHYRNQTVGTEDGKATKIHLNFKQIASDGKISEKDCRQKFQTLLGKELLSWPEEIVAAVKARILELWQQEQEPDIVKRKKLIKAKIEQEFRLKQQVQYTYKEIQNKIDHVLRKLQ